ncbi:MAG: 4Fe-4S dicluster domain-containing protein [Desulfovibrionaceae bacterium]
MASYRIKFNKDRCISCKACLVHCKQKNHLPVGVAQNKFECQLVADKNGKPTMKTKYQPCLMCKKPECVAACPTGAMYQRDDGLVLVNLEICDGCGSCVEACPFDSPSLNPETGKVAKCDYCIDRVEMGLEPACVTGCTGKALVFVRP